jgi:hypothetical protein
MRDCSTIEVNAIAHVSAGSEGRAVGIQQALLV